MKKSHLTPVYICVALAAALFSIISPTVSSADRSTPNWLVGEAQYTEGTPLDTGPECEVQTIRIEGLPNRVYPTSLSTYTDQETCVYDAGEYQYGWYMREYRSGMYANWESGIAVSWTTSGFVPMRGFGDKLADSQLYAGKSKLFVQYDNTTMKLKIYRDVTDHFMQDTDGTWYLDDVPDLRYEDADGNATNTYGLGFSPNKQWLAFGVRNFGIMMMNLNTFESIRVSDRYDVTSATWPTPGLRTSVSNDGDYVVVGGSAYQTEVISTLSCGSLSPFDGTKQLLGIDTCPYVNLSEITWNNSQASGTAGYRMLDKLQMSASGALFSYWDNYKWSTIYAPNYLMPGQLYYLALGDSYASGEGDVTLDGADHYLAGTNVYGDYMSGVPREMCHISTRAYSMRIAEAMQLTRGVDMQSVACSGAVASDILSIKLSENDYINSLYPSQSTQLIASSGPRLTGIVNASQLQDEARVGYQPGRVQQIEFVKKAKPKYMTVMVGGNDVDFGGVLSACATNALPSADETCDYAIGEGLAGEAQKVHDLYQKLLDFYNALQEVSPNTVIYAIGYPQFMDNTSESCAEMLNLYSQPERKAIHDLVAYANATVRNAALDAGVKYIDISNALVGNNLCSSGSAMTGITDMLATGIYTEYMKSVTMADSKLAQTLNIMPTGGLHKVALGIYLAERAAQAAGSYLYSPASILANISQELSHPNALGHGAIFDTITQGLGSDMLESTACNAIVACPGNDKIGAPNVAIYLPNVAMKDGVVYQSGTGKVAVGHKDTSGKTTLGSLVKSLAGQFIRIAAGLIDGTVDPSEPLTVEIHSDVVPLGEMSLVGDVYELQTSLPQNIPVGEHVLHIKGRFTDGRVFDVDAPVFVEGPLGDMDDDGIADSADTCAFGIVSGVDGDNDGIDDACDLAVTHLPSAGSGSVMSDAHVTEGSLRSDSPEVTSGSVWGVFTASKDAAVLADNRGSDIDIGATAAAPASSQESGRELPWYLVVLVLALGALALGWLTMRHHKRK